MRAILDSKEMGTQDQIARKMGLSPAFISTLWKTGVGGRSIDAFAELLGFSDAKALRDAAYDWYRSQQPRSAARAEEPAVLAAINDVQALHPNIPHEQIRTILHRFADDAFAGRDQDYWYRTLMEEVRRDFQRAALLRGERARQDDAAALEKKAIQAAFRQASGIKKQLQEQAIVDEIEAPAVHVEPPPAAEPKRRRAR